MVVRDLRARPEVGDGDTTEVPDGVH
jgi:hypothetical protein